MNPLKNYCQLSKVGNSLVYALTVTHEQIKFALIGVFIIENFFVRSLLHSTLAIQHYLYLLAQNILF